MASVACDSLVVSLPPLINRPIFRFQNVLSEKQLWFESVDTVNFCMYIAKVVVKHIASKASEHFFHGPTTLI